MTFPYDITKYNIDVICSHISYKTGTPFHLIKQKKQISYIDSYLCSPEVKVDTIIIENNYIEKNYTENYSEYYSRCFHPYPKVCSRIHFFRVESEQEWGSERLEELLNIRDGNLFESEEYSKLKTGYIGFIVIRPIPNTFLDKICLKPYQRLSSAPKNSIIKRKYGVSLFGMPLEVNSVAFQEQDKVLSACATSSLWSFTHATNHRVEKDIPSPGVITKLAKPSNHGHDRQFPNTGLSSYMIRRFINEIGLEPEQISLKEPDGYNSSLLKEYLYSFISSKIPLVCGASVYEEDGSDQNGNLIYRYKGDHAITLLGYSLSENTGPQGDIGLISYSIDKFYAHDDRVGPYTRFVFRENEKAYTDENGTRKVINNFLSTEIDRSASSEISSFKKEIIVPNILILGLYHKVRISYAAIKNTASAFNKFLIKFIETPVYQEFFRKINISKNVKSWVWYISLCEVNDFKKSIIESNLKNKIKYLTAHWPKYIWSVEVCDDEENPLFSLCFDATDIPQGKIFLDFLIFSQESAAFLEALSDHCERLVSNSMLGTISNIDTNSYIWGIINHLANIEQLSYSDILDDEYGEVRIPRYFKDSEIKNDSVYLQNNSRFEIYELCDLKLDNNKDYIWLINEEGWLILGEENLIAGSEDNKIGHVTLNKGRPGRIAGELRYKDGIWLINSKSGRYSGNYSSLNSGIYLKNAIEKRFLVYLKGYDFRQA